MLTSQGSKYAPGALVRARSRDWVVLPPDEPDVVRLRPVDGSDAEAVGIYLPLEQESLKPSEYALPAPELAGDFTGSLLLRDAVRLSLRSGAGPFRSMGRLSVVPRPYQFVPLIMALRLDPVRLLIADDVGVGKTIEAGMIARELLDRGVIRRIAVLCAPHLCEQWEEELRTKFNIDTAVVQSSRIGDWSVDFRETISLCTSTIATSLSVSILSSRSETDNTSWITPLTSSLSMKRTRPRDHAATAVASSISDSH